METWTPAREGAVAPEGSRVTVPESVALACCVGGVEGSYGFE
jgi:hypothetical protein